MGNRESTLRQRANEIKHQICKYLIAVIEDPIDIRNIGTVIRNVNALGAEKTYIVDPRKALPDDWQEMREKKSLSDTSVSAIKWSYVKRFDSTEECFAHLEKNRYTSIATSPHVKGKENYILHHADYTCPRLAVWFGNEKRGVSDLVLERSKYCVSIPMFGIIESLNLGTSTGIVLYEITKQRREYQEKYKRANRKKPVSVGAVEMTGKVHREKSSVVSEGEKDT